jgi:hypothetical protein
MCSKERVYQLEKIADASMNGPGAAGAIGVSLYAAVQHHCHHIIF